MVHSCAKRAAVMANAPPRTGSAGKARRKWGVTSRASRQARGYGREWELTRAGILNRDKRLCQPCLAKGRTVLASEVDHIKPRHKGGGEDWSNLQSICTDCHRQKTALEGQAARD